MFSSSPQLLCSFVLVSSQVLAIGCGHSQLTSTTPNAVTATASAKTPTSANVSPGSTPQAAPPQGSSVPDAPAAPLAPLDPSWATRACAGRSPCRWVDTHDGGRDAQGRALRVMALEMYDASAEEEDGSCTEYWLVVGEEASSLRHVTDYCYASNDIAETSDVIVGPNVITSSSGGDAAWWRNASETSFQLSPFRMLDETWSTEYLQAEAPLLREESWNWDDFEGKVSQQRPTCSEEDEQASSVRSAWLAIPRVTMPAEFAEDLWRTAKLEACSAQLDASDRRGFVVHGQAGASADAALTVLSSLDGSLYVEVRDDAFVTGGRKWLFDDHVELWLAEGGEEVDAMCTELHRTRPVQWGIRIADGKVFPAYGKPTEQLRVQSTGPRPDGTARMRIEVPRKYNRVTIVYSDGDDGQTQERLIATSQLTYGKAWTLGELKSIAPNEAICELVNGGLVARDTHDYSSR